MHRILLLSFISLSLAACSTIGARPEAVSAGISSDKFLDYQPISPLPALKVQYYDKQTGKFEDKFWAAFPNTKEGNAEKRLLLPIQSAYTYIIDDTGSGNLTYLTNSASVGVGNYTIISDYILYRVERVKNAGVGLVGVGMRVRAKVKTTEGGLNLSSLFQLAMEANAKHLSGELQVDVIGISSKDITTLFPALSAQISPESISDVMKALASIKAKISDSNVEITPYLLAFKQTRVDSESKILGSLAYVRGMQNGTAHLNQIAEIVSYLATDKNRWHQLIDTSDLSGAQKKKWKDVAVKDVFDRLRHDTGSGNNILQELYRAYKTLNAGDK